MSIIEELQELIKRTSSHRDREILERVLEKLQKTHVNTWGYTENSIKKRR